MAIVFDGLTIACGNVHSSVDFHGGQVRAQRTYFWGLRGTSEIVGGTAEWQASIRCWLNNSDWSADAAGYAALHAVLRELSALRGTNGRLTVTMSDGTQERQWSSATFEGFEPIPFDGHQEAGPILDTVGMVNSSGGWIMQGMLTWTILVDEG